MMAGDSCLAKARSAATRDAVAPGTTASHYAARRLAAAERPPSLSARALPREQEASGGKNTGENIADSVTWLNKSYDFVQEMVEEMVMVNIMGGFVQGMAEEMAVVNKMGGFVQGMAEEMAVVNKMGGFVQGTAEKKVGDGKGARV